MMDSIGCNCCNIVVNILSEQDGSPLKLDVFNNNNVRFFKEALGPYKKEQLNITREQPSLVQSIKIDNWTIYRCINCNNMVYGSANDGSDIDKNNIVINSKLRKTHDEITKLRKSDDYSPLFKIVIKKMANSEASIAVEGKDSVLELKSSRIRALKEQLEHYVQIETNTIEEKIRLYTQQCYSNLNIKRKCSEEQCNQLINLIKRVPEDMKIRDGTIESEILNTLSAAATNLETPPATPDANVLPMSVGNSPPILNFNVTKTQNGNNNETMKNSQQTINIMGKNIEGTKNSAINFQSPMLYDDECLFDLDGIDNDSNDRSRNKTNMFYNENINDDDADDSENEIMQENIEGSIRIVSQHGKHQSNSASSLPINMPTLLNQFRTTEEDFEELPEDNIDIAASIKAIAKSVHGGVFGDLPRPRFSTQL